MLILGSSQAVSITPRPMLVIEGISKVFGRVHAVDNVSLSIPGGQFVGVIGRSGAGKSTLLRLLNRLTEPTGGRILWRGTEVTALRGRKLRRAVTSVPRHKMRPPVGSVSRLSRRNNVDLPAPERPITPTNWPPGMLSDT